MSESKDTRFVIFGSKNPTRALQKRYLKRPKTRPTPPDPSPPAAPACGVDHAANLARVHQNTPGSCASSCVAWALPAHTGRVATGVGGHTRPMVIFESDVVIFRLVSLFVTAARAVISINPTPTREPVAAPHESRRVAIASSVCCCAACLSTSRCACPAAAGGGRGRVACS